MTKRVISFSPPDISELEIAEVTEALRSGWITTGPRTKLLERRLAHTLKQEKQMSIPRRMRTIGVTELFALIPQLLQKNLICGFLK